MKMKLSKPATHTNQPCQEFPRGAKGVMNHRQELRLRMAEMLRATEPCSRSASVCVSTAYLFAGLGCARRRHTGYMGYTGYTGYSEVPLLRVHKWHPSAPRATGQGDFRCRPAREF